MSKRIFFTQQRPFDYMPLRAGLGLITEADLERYTVLRFFAPGVLRPKIYTTRTHPLSGEYIVVEGSRFKAKPVEPEIKFKVSQFAEWDLRGVLTVLPGSQSPTPKGVGMSREGYGQQVDKEAYKNMQKLEERNTYTPTDIPHVSGNCDLSLNREETLSVAGLKTSSNNSDAALTGFESSRTGLASSCCKNSPLLTENTIAGIVKPVRHSSPTSKVGVSMPEDNEFDFSWSTFAEKDLGLKGATPDTLRDELLRLNKKATIDTPFFVNMLEAI